MRGAMNTCSLWLEKLRLASGSDAASLLLAQALGELSGAQQVGVFLLDNTRSNLLLFASWTAEKGAHREDRQSLPLQNLEDPLCLALQQGTLCRTTLLPGLDAHVSIRLLQVADRAEGCDIWAMPLLTWGNATIGGAVLYGCGLDAHDMSSGIRENVDALCACAALLFALLEQKECDGRRIHDLQDDVARLSRPHSSEGATVSRLLVGQSAAMRQVREQIMQVASYAVSVLITGETGTGKELAATAIHAASPRAGSPFMKINCGALPAQLLESELFGHKKGAFSGAIADHMGLLRSADGGTVLLDEVGEMPLEIQVKLLRVLQDRELRPVGDVRSYPVDIRIVAATNRDMEAFVAAGGFRKDLYYRLAAYHIQMPPLRERREDVPALALLFLERFAKRHGMQGLSIKQEQMLELCAHEFPGNVRELMSLVENAVIFKQDGDDSLHVGRHIHDAEHAVNCMTLGERVASYEMSLINAALVCNEGNISKAARSLGVPRTSLITKMNRARSASRQECVAEKRS